MGVFYASTGDLKLYLNGVLEPTEPSTMTSIYSGTADLRIGARQYPGHRCFFNGIIDEVRISNIARQPLDVDPDTLNLESKGKWITAYVTVPGWHRLFEDDFDTLDGWTVVDGTWAIEDGQLSGFSDSGTGPHYGTAKLKIRTTENFAVERIFAAEVTFLGWNPATSTEWQRVGIIIQKDPAFDTHASTPGKNDWALLIRGDNRLYLLNEYVAWDGFIPFTPTVGTTYRMKMAWDGSTIKGKAWAVGDTEPLAWQLSVSWTNVVTDPSIGLYCSYAHVHFDDIILTTYVSEIDINNVVLYNGVNGAVSAVFDPKYEFVTDMFAYAVDVDGEGTLERLVKFNRMEVINGLEPGDYTFTVEAIQLDGTKLVYPYAIRLIKPGK